METQFDADEVLQMAERIEIQAARFFRDLAERSDSPTRRTMLLDLAGMEEDHEKVFVGLRAILAASGRAQPSAQAGRYSRMVMAMCVDVQSDLMRMFRSDEPAEQIIRQAIEFEKNSIVFYAGMKQMVPDARDRESIDAIIKEELGHILSLSGYFVPAGGTPTSLPAPRTDYLRGHADGH